MEKQESPQFNPVNSSLQNLGQQHSSLLSGGLLESSELNLNRAGSFRDRVEADLSDLEIKAVEHYSEIPDSVLGATPKFVANSTILSSSRVSDNFDSLTGKVASVGCESVLNLATSTAKQQLKSFADDEEFIGKMRLAFGDDWHPQKGDALIQSLAVGKAILNIEILPATNLNGNGAFGEDTIYLSEKFLTKNATNPEAVASVLLEEIGHYIDRELNSIDSPGDEGDIFSRLVRDETIDKTELGALKTEDDSDTIFLNGKETPVELAAPPYPGYSFKYESGQKVSYDANVEAWQQRMKDRGWNIDVDGKYGPQSKKIARQFQQEKGLEDDGIVGPQTWATAFRTDNVTSNGNTASAPPYPGYSFKYEPGQKVSYDANVEAWQQRMKDRGWNIDVDGKYGPQSKRIAIQFQQNKGLEVDGRVGPQTWATAFRTDNVTSGGSNPPSSKPPSVTPTGNAVKDLLNIANSYVGVREEGHNGGAQVKKFQRAVDGRAEGEPWCMSFVQYCIKAAESAANASSSVYRSEGCVNVWNNSPKSLRLSGPEPGSIVIWEYGNSGRGHTGIVEQVNSNGTFTTIEGNTSGGSGINREGDGVYRRQRDMDGSGNMRIRGFLKVF